MLLNELGQTWTIFENLGGITSLSKFKFPKFNISQVMPTLEQPECSDKNGLQSIRKYMTNLEEFPFIVTLVEESFGYLVVDGDKHAVAFYEREKNKSKGDLIDFRGFSCQV